MSVPLSRRRFFRLSFGAAGAVAVAPLAAAATRSRAAASTLIGMTRSRLPSTVNDPFPLSFREVVRFHGDFGPNEVVNGKGVSYDHLLKQLVVSLSPFFVQSGLVQILNVVDPATGTRAPFATGLRHMDRAIESKIVTVPPTGPPVEAGFTPGDTFVPITGGQIGRIDWQGNVLADPWVTIDDTAGFWGDLHFDDVGTFGGALLVLSLSRHVYAVTPGAAVTTVLDLANVTIDGHPAPPGWGYHPEGLTVARSSFGPYEGQLILGIEGSSDFDPYKGTVWAIDDAARATLVVKLSTAAEDVEFVPDNGGTYYQCEIDFNTSYDENRLWAITSSQFLGRRGHLLAVNELIGEISDAWWDGAAFRSTVAGKCPGPWLTTGFSNQNEELESGCFAAVPPSVASFSAPTALPGAFRTRSALAAWTGPGGRVVNVVGRAAATAGGLVAGGLYMSRYDTATGHWLRPLWAEVAPVGMRTNLAPGAAAYQGASYVFAVRGSDGVVVGTIPAAPTPAWTEVPPAFVSSAAATASVVNGRLVVCARNANDGSLSPNALSGSTWTGWSSVPGSDGTVGPAGLAAFQDDLWVMARDAGGAVLATALVAGGRWTEWTEIPGGGLTDDAIAAATPSNGQLYLFLKSVGSVAPLMHNPASVTGTWNGGWLDLGTVVSEAPAVAAADKLYLFGVDAIGRPLMRATGPISR